MEFSISMIIISLLLHLRAGCTRESVHFRVGVGGSFSLRAEFWANMRRRSTCFRRSLGSADLAA
jgi:hypothetical protein